METNVIILEGKFSEDTNKRIKEFLDYIASIEDIVLVKSNIGGGGFINTKPTK